MVKVAAIVLAAGASRRMKQAKMTLAYKGGTVLGTVLTTMHSAGVDPLIVVIGGAKDAVENSFDDLKNHLDMKRLRIHSSASMDARLFLQFLALIYISQIRNVIQADKILRNLTVREVMEDMETLVQIKYSHRYGQLYTETNPIQRKIMSAFNVTLPT